MNKTQTSFYNKKVLLMKESIKEKPLHIIYQFLEEAIQEYFKTNTALSKGIIWCFSAAKKIIRDEVKEINDFLSGKSKR